MVACHALREKAQTPPHQDERNTKTIPLRNAEQLNIKKKLSCINCTEV